MKICLVFDSHDHRGHLAAAVADAKARGAQAVLHCGDLRVSGRAAPSRRLQPDGPGSGAGNPTAFDGSIPCGYNYK